MWISQAYGNRSRHSGSHGNVPTLNRTWVKSGWVKLVCFMFQEHLFLCGAFIRPVLGYRVALQCVIDSRQHVAGLCHFQWRCCLNCLQIWNTMNLCKEKQLTKKNCVEGTVDCGISKMTETCGKQSQFYVAKKNTAVFLMVGVGTCVMCSFAGSTRFVHNLPVKSRVEPRRTLARLPPLPTKAAFVCKRKESMTTTYTWSVFWFVHSSHRTTCWDLFCLPPSLSVISYLVRQVCLILWNKQHCIAFRTAMYKSVLALQENCYGLSDSAVADRFLSFCYLQ